MIHGEASPTGIPINSGDAAASQIQPTLRSIIFTRSFAITALVYFLLLGALFWRLFIGQIWNSNAGMRLVPPFAPVHTIDAVPYVSYMEGDFSDQFIYFQEYQYRSAQLGRFPTWNPYIYMGQPFHADGQSAMLFPFDWIYFLIDPNSARGWMAILRLWVSATALFCLLRKLDLSPSAAFTGGAVWMFCSFNMHWLAWPHSNASLWMPVMMLAIDFLLVGPSLKYAAIAALAAAPLFLAGHPGTEYIAGITVAFYALCRLISLIRSGVPRSGIARRIGLLAAAMITAMLIAAAALLPLWMQIRQSYDYLDTSGARGIVPIVEIPALWLMLIPEFFGRSRGAFPTNLYIGPSNYVEVCLWFGAVALAIAICAALGTLLPGALSSKQARREPYRFLAGFGITALVVSVMLAFSIEPVNSIAMHMPGATLTNLGRFQMATGLAGAVLTAIGLHRILERRDRAASLLASLLAFALCAVVLRELCVHWHQHQRQLAESFTKLRASFGEKGAKQLIPAMLVQSAVWRMRIGMVLLFAGSTALLWITVGNFRSKPIPPALRFIFIGLIVLDVVLPAVEWQPVAPRDLVLPEPPPVLQAAISRSAKGRMLATTSVILAPNVSMHFGFKDIRGYDLPHSLRLERLLKRLKLDEFDGRGIIDPSRFFPQIEPELKTYLDRTSVICVLNRVTTPQPSGTAATPGKPSPMPESKEFIFPNPNAYPRAYLAQTALQIDSPQQAMETLLDSSVDLRTRSVFEGHEESQRTGPANPAGESATITTDEPEKVAIQTQTTTRQLLVLNDRMDIGWTVTVDGQPADALTANYLFRGVFVPPGQHTIEWTYRAPGLAAGVVISLTALLAVLTTLLAASLHETAHRASATNDLSFTGQLSQPAS